MSRASVTGDVVSSPTDLGHQTGGLFLSKKAPNRDGCHGSPWPVMATTPSQNTDQEIREMAMKETVIFVGLGLVLAGLDFALDAGIVAMVVLPS
jgi:hypothetical protein